MSVPPSPAFWVAVALYGVGATLLFAVLSGRSALRTAALGAVIAAFVAHGVDIGWRGVLHVHPAQSVREALGFLAWIIAGGYLVASLRYRLTVGGVALVPVVLSLLLAARLSPAGTDVGPQGMTTLGRVHISLATLGVGIFALASAISVVYLVEDRALRRKRFQSSAFADGGTPLEALDRLAQRLVWLGFPIFTIAMALGVVWVSRRGDSFARPEYLLAVVTWCSFAASIILRFAAGWRGRRAAKLALVGFIAAVLVLLVYLLRGAA